MTPRRLGMLGSILGIMVICSSIMWLASAIEIPDRRDLQQWESANRSAAWATALLILGFGILLASWPVERAGRRQQRTGAERK